MKLYFIKKKYNKNGIKYPKIEEKQDQHLGKIIFKNTIQSLQFFNNLKYIMNRKSNS